MTSCASECPLAPAQDGNPLWIAGAGEKRTLRLATELAQYTNFDGRPDVFAHKSAVLTEHRRDLGEITRSSNYTVVTGETDREVLFESAVIPEVG